MASTNLQRSDHLHVGNLKRSEPAADARVRAERIEVSQPMIEVSQLLVEVSGGKQCTATARHGDVPQLAA